MQVCLCCRRRQKLEAMIDKTEASPVKKAKLT
jgi:hypothetical protein